MSGSDGSGSNDLRPLDLSGGRILIVNDDGIEARGLKELERIAARLDCEVWTVAPADGRSAASAQVSLRKPLQIVELSERRYAVTGTPADSTIAALKVVMKDHPPTLVLSGINHGANLGEDVHYSGTVGAASAAAISGIPAMALSLGSARGFEAVDVFDDMHRRGPDLIQRLCARGFGPGLVYNVNFPSRLRDPDAPALFRPQAGPVGTTFEFVQQDGMKSNHYILHHNEDRVAPDSTKRNDYDTVHGGDIAVTPLSLDRSAHHILQAFGEAV